MEPEKSLLTGEFAIVSENPPSKHVSLHIEFCTLALLK